MKRKQEYSEANFDSEGNFDLQQTIDERDFNREWHGQSKATFVAPGADQKWRARNLVDIYWVLTGIKTPSEVTTESCHASWTTQTRTTAFAIHGKAPLLSRRDTASRL